MEYASWLAGERWSDHPGCTHPLLSSVARQVNDHTSDSARSRLVGLVPAVIGLNGDDPRVDIRIVVRCAALAIPVVAEYRQRALAVSLLSARALLSDLDHGTRSPADEPTLELAVHALAGVPCAVQWAERFTAGTDVTLKAFQRRAAPAATRVAVVGIAEATIPDPDSLLHELLTRVIEDCADWLDPEPNTKHTPHEIPAASTG